MVSSGTTWRMADGRTIPIAEMDDDHLRAAIARIERRATGERAELIRWGREQLHRCTTSHSREIVIHAIQSVISRAPDPEGANSKYAALVSEREHRIEEGGVTASSHGVRRWWDV